MQGSKGAPFHKKTCCHEMNRFAAKVSSFGERIHSLQFPTNACQHRYFLNICKTRSTLHLCHHQQQGHSFIKKMQPQFQTKIFLTVCTRIVIAATTTCDLLSDPIYNDYHHSIHLDHLLQDLQKFLKVKSQTD